jgi:hypothetical protein
MNISDQWDSEFVPKAKRTFSCGYCNGKIPAGTSCHKEMGFVQGEFLFYHLCNRCKSLAGDNVSDPAGMLSSLFEKLLLSTNISRCPRCGKLSPKEFTFADDQHLYVDIECGSCGYNYQADLTFENIQTVLAEKRGDQGE